MLDFWTKHRKLLFPLSTALLVALTSGALYAAKFNWPFNLNIFTDVMLNNLAASILISTALFSAAVFITSIALYKNRNYRSSIVRSGIYKAIDETNVQELKTWVYAATANSQRFNLDWNFQLSSNLTLVELVLNSFKDENDLDPDTAKANKLHNQSLSLWLYRGFIDTRDGFVPKANTPLGRYYASRTNKLNRAQRLLRKLAPRTKNQLAMPLNPELKQKIIAKLIQFPLPGIEQQLTAEQQQVLNQARTKFTAPVKFIHPKYASPKSANRTKHVDVVLNQHQHQLMNQEQQEMQEQEDYQFDMVLELDVNIVDESQRHDLAAITDQVFTPTKCSWYEDSIPTHCLNQPGFNDTAVGIWLSHFTRRFEKEHTSISENAMHKLQQYGHNFSGPGLFAQGDMKNFLPKGFYIEEEPSDSGHPHATLLYSDELRTQQLYNPKHNSRQDIVITDGQKNMALMVKHHVILVPRFRNDDTEFLQALRTTIVDPASLVKALNQIREERLRGYFMSPEDQEQFETSKWLPDDLTANQTQQLYDSYLSNDHQYVIFGFNSAGEFIIPEPEAKALVTQDNYQALFGQLFTDLDLDDITNELEFLVNTFAIEFGDYYRKGSSSSSQDFRKLNLANCIYIAATTLVAAQPNIKLKRQELLAFFELMQNFHAIELDFPIVDYKNKVTYSPLPLLNIFAYWFMDQQLNTPETMAIFMKNNTIARIAAIINNPEHLKLFIALGYKFLSHKKPHSPLVKNQLKLGQLITAIESITYFFESQKLPLPSSEVIIANFNDYNDSFHTYIKLQELIRVISLSSQKQEQMQLFNSGQIRLRYFNTKRHLIEQGYSCLHNAMFAITDIRTTHIEATVSRATPYQESAAYKAYKFFYEKIANPYFITPDEFAKIEFSEQVESRYYKAYFLRFIAYNTEQDIYEVLAKWTELSTDNFSAANWDALKNYALELPFTAKETQATAAKQPKKFKLPQTYDLTHLDTIIARFALSREFTEQLRNAFIAINKTTAAIISPEFFHQWNSYNKYAQTKLKDIRNKIKEAEYDDNLTNPEFLQLIAELRVAFYLNHPKKIDLRLEQLLIVLINANSDHLNNFDTSEGKTVVIQFLALLKAACGHKVDILTHSEEYARRDCKKHFRRLAADLGLVVANNFDHHTNFERRDADIFYNDISSAPLAHMVDLHSEPKIHLRPTEVVIIDEVDNAVDISATTAYQAADIDESTVNSDDLKQFLTALIKAYQATPMQSLNDLHDHLKNTLNDNRFVATITEPQLEAWSKAVQTAANYQLDNDYCISYAPHIGRHQIHIMHKDTSGREDKQSIWGKYLHQVIAAKEGLAHPEVDIEIPALTIVYADLGIPQYLSLFESRIGFTGSIGEADTIAVELDMLGLPNEPQTVIVMPRAKRKHPVAGAIWPQVVVNVPSAELAPEAEAKQISAEMDLAKPYCQYNRRFDYLPRFVTGKEAHFEALGRQLLQAQAAKQANILFFRTIAECNEFYEFLRLNKFNLALIQIFDDTHPEQDPDNIRPSEAEMLVNAEQPGFITLTTAAGGRATDFAAVDAVGFAKPALYRVVLQGLGRGGRNGRLAYTYQILDTDDLDFDIHTAADQTVLDRAPEEMLASVTMAAAIYTPWQRAQQAESLDRIKAKSALDCLKLNLRVAFYAFRDECLAAANTDSDSDAVAYGKTEEEELPADQSQPNNQERLDPRYSEFLATEWKSFYPKIATAWEDGQLEAVLALWQEYFKDTAWQQQPPKCLQAAAPAGAQRPELIA